MTIRRAACGVTPLKMGKAGGLAKPVSRHSEMGKSSQPGTAGSVQALPKVPHHPDATALN